jgi:hypothetical protein
MRIHLDILHVSALCRGTLAAAPSGQATKPAAAKPATVPPAKPATTPTKPAAGGRTAPAGAKPAAPKNSTGAGARAGIGKFDFLAPGDHPMQAASVQLLETQQRILQSRQNIVSTNVRDER